MSSLFLFLYIGTTSAILNISGKIPSDIDLFISVLIGTFISSFRYLTSLELILSCPELFLGFNFWISLYISSGSVVFKKIVFFILWLRYSCGDLFVFGIFLAYSGPTFVKYSQNAFVISCSLVNAFELYFII